MDVTAIREGVKQALDLDDMHVYSYWPDSPNTPCVAIYPDHIDYSDSYDNTDHATFTVLAITGTVASQSASQKMDAWLSSGNPESIVSAIDVDPTLGGACDSARITEMKTWSMQALQDGGTRYLMAEFVLDVYA